MDGEKTLRCPKALNFNLEPGNVFSSCVVVFELAVFVARATARLAAWLG